MKRTLVLALALLIPSSVEAQSVLTQPSTVNLPYKPGAVLSAPRLGTDGHIYVPYGGPSKFLQLINGAGDTISGTIATSLSSGNFDPGSWSSLYGNNTQAPTPDQYGTAMSPTISNCYPGVNGINQTSIGDRTFLQCAALLVQVSTIRGNNQQEQALGINFRNVSGGGSLPSTNHDQKVALSVFARGETNGSDMTGMNIDMPMMSDFVKGGIGLEVDLDNYGTAFPENGRNSYAYKAVANGNHITAIYEAEGGPLSNDYSAHFGANFSAAGGATAVGKGLIGEATINDGTNSLDMIRNAASGNHNTGLNTTSGSVTYPLFMKQGQQLTFNIYDAILTYVGSNTLRYLQNGGAPLQIVGSSNGVNGIGITSAPAGFGAIIKPATIGADTNIPLNLQGLGTSPVQVLSSFSITGGMSAPGLVTTAGTAKGSMCIDTTGVVYVKTTTGACI